MNMPENRETQWDSPIKTLTIERLPPDATGTLRGWDTADDYLIRETLVALDDFTSQSHPKKLAIVDDDFGALTTAISQLAQERDDIEALYVVADSSLSQEAITANVNANAAVSTDKPPVALTIVGAFDALPSDLQLDIVLLKVPKTTASFEYQLRQLRTLMSKGSCILAAGMVKHLLPATQDTLERTIGPTTRLLAVKKARLFNSKLDLTRVPDKNQYPRKLYIEQLGLGLLSDAGVFSANKADPASLFLCEHLPEHIRSSASETVNKKKLVMDLGCGSGLLGLAAALKYPDSTLCFVDSSACAIRNAEINYRNSHPESTALYLHQHRLLPWVNDPVDLILCNPPFHQKHTLTLDPSLQMFADAREVMRPGAEFFVVANRHLPYRGTLKRLFGNHRTVAQNTKFTIHRVIKRG